MSRSSRRRSALGLPRGGARVHDGPGRGRAAAFARATSPAGEPFTGGSRSEPAVPIRVVLAEDSLIVREGLRELLAGSPAVDVVGSYGDPDSVLARLGDDRPTWSSPTSRCLPSGAARASTWRPAARAHPDIGVVILSQYAEPGFAIELLEHGSAGRAYLLKERVGRPRRADGGDPRRRHRRLGDRPEDRGHADRERARPRSVLAS